MHQEQFKQIIGVLEGKGEFLTTHTHEEAIAVCKAFDALSEWFFNEGSEQFAWPDEFREALAAHHRHDARVEETLVDVRNRWLIMMEMRDYAKLKHWI